MTLAPKLDRIWISSQLAHGAPLLSVADRAVAPYTTMTVERVENHALWNAYEARRSELRAHGATPRRERSRPINCELDDDEQLLFHGTGCDAISSIITSGFDPSRAQRSSRYGIGCYFSDESCKAHQYAEAHMTQKADGSSVFKMLYARVVPGRALTFKSTRAAAARWASHSCRARPTSPR